MPPQIPAVEDMMHGASLPTGTEVASYATHNEAQAAVDYLAEHDFDIRSVSIVGMDVHLVEHITGRLGVGRVAFGGATSGMLWGFIFGFMVSLTNTAFPNSVWMGIGVAGGALAGIILAVISYMMRGGKRDFISHTHAIAGRYAVIVADNAQNAFDLLQKTPGNQRRPARPRPRPTRSVSDGPTEYGSRPDEKPRFGVRLSDIEAQRSSDEAPAPASSESVKDSAEEAPVAAEAVAPTGEAGAVSGGDEQESPQAEALAAEENAPTAEVAPSATSASDSARDGGASEEAEAADKPRLRFAPVRLSEVAPSTDEAPAAAPTVATVGEADMEDEEPSTHTLPNGVVIPRRARRRPASSAPALAAENAAENASENAGETVAVEKESQAGEGSPSTN